MTRPSTRLRALATQGKGLSSHLYKCIGSAPESVVVMEGTAEQTLISFIFVAFSSAAEYQDKRRRQVVEKLCQL
jgi:hypothetical protein